MKNNIKITTLLLSTLISLSSMAMESVSHKSYVVMSPGQTRPMLQGIQDANMEGEEKKRQIKENGFYSTYSENASSLIAYKNKKIIRALSEDSDPIIKI